MFSPKTIFDCYLHDGTGLVPGIKNDENKWNTVGHASRILRIDQEILMLFARLYDEPGTPVLQARLPALHSQELISVLHRFANANKRLNDFNTEIFTTEFWHETGAQKDNTIKRNNTGAFAKETNEFILSGPHFFVGNPHYKTPRAKCVLNSDYDNIDLTELPNDYLPRTNYAPACPMDIYSYRTPIVPWLEANNSKSLPVTAYYRFVNRRMFGVSAERSLISAIAPKFSANINTVLATVMRSPKVLANFAAATFSIVYDFYLRSTGKSDLYASMLATFPYYDLPSATIRGLMLNCLTTHYAEFWQACWQKGFNFECWGKNDSRLNNNFFAQLTPEWQRSCALRSDYERRQALVEIDVLVAMAMGLTLKELQTIYRIQFPVLSQNESDTWYDRRGRIVFTCSKGLVGVGFSRPEWNEIKDMQSGTVERKIVDDTMPGGPVERTIVYEAPFDRCDREADYATVWAEFERRRLAEPQGE